MADNKRDPRPIIREVAEALRLLQSNEQADKDRAKVILAGLNAKIGGGGMLLLLFSMRQRGLRLRGLD